MFEYESNDLMFILQNKGDLDYTPLMYNKWTFKLVYWFEINNV